jgi:glycine/D-amino acid oxidase-like deaminating enzyme
MTLSYWEKNSWFSNIDFCVVGSGIVGLSCALQLKKNHPAAKILVLERGFLPNGASTKNAGFACFGSISEILSDLKTNTEEEVFDLVEQRYNGLKLLRSSLGDKALGYKNNGGYEVFFKKNQELFEKCLSKTKHINELLKPIFKKEVFKINQDRFNFQNTFNELIENPFEGQLDVGEMMKSLLQKVQSLGVMVLNNAEVIAVENDIDKVKIKLKDITFYARHVFIATNAFSKELIDVELKPARNQVLITKPIKNLSVRGAFHLEEGYYYFRNVRDRVLIGGGRHLNKKRETTDKFETTSEIQNALENLLHNVILGEYNFEIDHRWSGILGVGKTKKPILRSLNGRLHCAVRLGGMGVAIGSGLGKKLAEIIDI